MKISRTVVNITVFVLFVAVCLGWMGFLATNIGLRVPGQGGYELRAAFVDANGLVPQDEVRVSGVKVGTVTALEAGADGSTVARMRIATSIKLHADTRAVIRPKNLLGAKMIELVRNPGSTAPILRPGALIALKQTGQAVEIDDVLNKMDAPTRQAFSTTLQQLGVALDGRAGDVNQTILNADQLAADLRPLAQLGDRRQEDIARILADLEIILQALADEQEQLGRLINSGDKVYAGIAARDGDLRGAIVNADQFFASLDTIFSDPKVIAANRAALEGAPGTINANTHTLSLINPNVGQLIPALLLGQVNYPADQLTVSQHESQSLAVEWMSAFAQTDVNGVHSFRITSITGDKTLPSPTPPSGGLPGLPGLPSPPSVPGVNPPPSPDPLCLVVRTC